MLLRQRRSRSSRSARLKRYRGIAIACSLLAFASIGAGQPAAGTVPGVNGEIAFDDSNGELPEIYTMASDGSGLTNVTNESNHDELQPAWSPDGSKIAFTSNRDGNYEIYVMSATGSGVTRLTNNSAYDDAPA